MPDNRSLSAAIGVVRGLHFRIPPHAQEKLVRMVRGAVLDVAGDLWHGSPSFGQHVAVELGAVDWRQLWIPAGFAHGFCTLGPDIEVIDKVTDFYDVASERGLAWGDPDLGMAWPVLPAGCRASPNCRIVSASTSELDPMRVIVAGGAGFIGSAVCRLPVGALGYEALDIDKLACAANPGSLRSIGPLERYGFAYRSERLGPIEARSSETRPAVPRSACAAK